MWGGDKVMGWVEGLDEKENVVRDEGKGLPSQFVYPYCVF